MTTRPSVNSLQITSASGDLAAVNTNLGMSEVSANSGIDSSWFCEGDHESHQMAQYSLWAFLYFY